jgi:hypothetical protein
MKKTIILVTGALALVGTGAYLFFKNKKKKSDILEEKKSVIASETPAVTPQPDKNSNTELIGPKNSDPSLLTMVEKTSVAYGIDDIKLEQARAILKKYLKIMNVKGIGGRTSYQKTMDAKLKKIGYIYQDGLLRKIVPNEYAK